MDVKIGLFIGAFVILFVIYCLFLLMRSIFKSNPLDYFKILELEADFKNKRFDKLSENGETILVQAVKLGAESLAFDIIKSGKVDVTKQATDGTSALFYAVVCKNIKLVKALLKAGEQVDPKKCGAFGSPLLWASRAGSIEVINLFLEKGADINRQTTKAKYNALMGACFTLKETAISHLLSMNADKKLKNREKQTALDVYKKSGGKNNKIIEQLS